MGAFIPYKQCASGSAWLPSRWNYDGYLSYEVCLMRKSSRCGASVTETVGMINEDNNWCCSSALSIRNEDFNGQEQFSARPSSEWIKNLTSPWKLSWFGGIASERAPKPNAINEDEAVSCKCLCKCSVKSSFHCLILCVPRNGKIEEESKGGSFNAGHDSLGSLGGEKCVAKYLVLCQFDWICRVSPTLTEVQLQRQSCTKKKDGYQHVKMEFMNSQHLFPLSLTQLGTYTINADLSFTPFPLQQKLDCQNLFLFKQVALWLLLFRRSFLSHELCPDTKKPFVSQTCQISLSPSPHEDMNLLKGDIAIAFLFLPSFEVGDADFL